MIRKPSYWGGFARSAGESANPDLWTTLDSAWLPELGASGDSLYEHAGYRKTGTLSGSTKWVNNLLNFTVDGDKVSVPTKTYSRFTITIKLRASAYASGWIMPLGKFNSSDNFIGRTTTAFTTRFNTGTNYTISPAPPTYVEGTLETWTFTYDGTTYKAYIDGLFIGSVSVPSLTFTLDSIGYAFTGTAFSFEGDIHGVLVHREVIPESQIKVLGSNILAPFELVDNIVGFVAPVVGGISIPVVRYYRERMGMV